MNRRECFEALVNHQEPDRVLVDFGKHIGSFHVMAYEQLKQHMGILIGSETRILDRMAQNVVLDEAICQRLGIDFRWVVPHWVRVRDIQVDGEAGYVDMWQTPHKYTEIGHYYAIAGWPLGEKDLTLDDIQGIDWPDPHDPAMFVGLGDQAKAWYEHTDYVVGADGIKVGVLQTASQLRGYDKLFLDFALDPDLTHAFLGKITDLIKDMYVEYMNVVGPYVQVVVITDDQGTQKSLMVSPAMFREFIKPRLREIIDAIRGQADVKVLMHCDGAILPIINDLIEIGVDILNPVQTVVKGLQDTQALKKEYGDRICFHGAIDVQQVMPNATVEEIRQEVARRVNDLGPGGGYILAPCHNINVDIPLENVLAMFEAAHEFGQYPLD